MDANLIDEVINQELNMNPSDIALLDHSEEEDIYSSSDDEASDEIPESMLTYFEASKNRIRVFEKLIFEDLEDDDFTAHDVHSINSSRSEDLLRDLASGFDEDPLKLKEQVVSEMEDDELTIIPNDVSPPTVSEADLKDSVPQNDEDAIECDAYLESERRFDLELKALECTLKEEEKRKNIEYQVKQEKHQKEQREKEEWSRQRQRHFEEELRMIEEANKPDNTDKETREKETEKRLQQELLQQQELISSLQRQMEEEKRAFEDAQEEEKRRRHKSRCKAAIKIQAALRGLLVRRWSRAQLHRRREEQRRCEEEERRMRKEWEERRTREREEERRRREVEEQELDRRRREYERTKEEERIHLERERRQEERREMEEVDRKREEEERRKREEEENRKREEEKIKEEERRKREKRQREEGERKKMEKRRNEEEKRKKEEEQRRKNEEEEKRKEEEEQRRKNEEEEKQKKEEEERTFEEEARIKNLEEERKTTDEIKRTEEEVPNSSTTHTPASPRPLGILNPTHLLRPISMPVTVEDEPGKPSSSHLSPASLPDSGLMCLPDPVEQKRLAWMRDCTPWSKLSLQNKRSNGTTPGRRGARRGTDGSSLPPLCPDTLLHSGAWNSLQEVTTVTLEDLPGCSLSTLAQCPRLQSLTLRRCGLKALDSLSQCRELQYIDAQENAITFVDCENLANLRVLRLSQNRLTSIHGLGGAVNLTDLELSHNCITRIGGLEPLKRLQRLLIDHNQLISTKGLRKVYMLLNLDLSHNHLSSVEGLENCALLNTLDLRGNNLTEPPGLRNQVLLRELRLEDNSISSLEGLTTCWLPLMQLLSGAQNCITQLPSLTDCVSLVKLDVSHNCLSELQNVCESLEGCPLLQEVDLTGNPLQQETSWRYSLLKAVPGLKDIDGQQTGFSLSPPAGAVSTLPQGSFLAFCQAQLQQLHTLQHKHNRELSIALSPLDALRISYRHSEEAMQLAKEQRYAHEYGNTSVTERNSDMSDTQITKIPGETPDMEDIDTHEACVMMRHESESSGNSQSRNVPLVSPTRDNSHARTSEKQAQPPADELHCSPGNVSSRPTLELEVSTVNASSPEGNPSNAKPSSVPPPPKPPQKLDLKNVAALLIQHHWRRHRTRRRIQLCSPQADEGGIVGGRGGGGTGRVDYGSNHNEQVPLDPGYAATVIQALWRGYALRKRLASALADAAAAHPDAGEEGFEEVDVDEFDFDEATLERDWMALLFDDSPPKTLPFPDQLLRTKYPVHHHVPTQQRSPPALLWKPKQAWLAGERAEPTEQPVSPDSISRTKSPASASVLSGLSARSESILEEWGFTDSHTAFLMLKRAQKMKSKKQRQRKLLDPSVRLALFRNHSNQHVPIEVKKKISLEKIDYFKAREAELVPQEGGKVDRTQLNQERTYQWLHTQAVHSEKRLESDHFLPEIDPDILNGGRVQLVAGSGYRGPDQASGSRANDNSISLPRREHNPARINSMGHSKTEVPSPKRVTSAPSKKERISFRDNPVQMSGGWGGGKKRDKLCK